MGITVDFYKTASDIKVVDKILTNKLTLSNVILKEGGNVGEPVLKLN